jgi:hypothetical protein
MTLEGASTGLTPLRRGRSAQHEMLAQNIACVAGQAAFHGRQNQGRGRTARSTKAVVESRVDLEVSGRSAQRWLGRMRALARRSNMDSARVQSYLQPRVAVTCKRDIVAKIGHSV